MKKWKTFSAISYPKKSESQLKGTGTTSNCSLKSSIFEACVIKHQD